jgi:hypothetical protein
MLVFLITAKAIDGSNVAGWRLAGNLLDVWEV